MKSETIPWPALDWEQWKGTAKTLHMFMQIVGKTRLKFVPLQNHWWNVALYLSARGLSTLAMPLPGGELLDIEFDFIDHKLTLRHSDGHTLFLPLRSPTVATFFELYKASLERLGVQVLLNPNPVEINDPIRFDKDLSNCTYDPDSAHRFWLALSRANGILKSFSSNFYGKISPVHFFWGSFDLAVTRFNGERAPKRPGADSIQAEAYSHKCISAGFWPGNGGYGQAAFYCYAAPLPAGLSTALIPGPGAFNEALGEFILNYEDVRRSSEPGKTVYKFLESTYAAAAEYSKWDRAQLDRPER